MSDLQRAMTASQPALAGAGPSRRGVHQVLLSARETSFLAARFVLDAAPSTAELRRLELLCDIPEHRLYKYFNNQRFSRKRKAGSALGLDEKADREPHADSQLQPVQSSGTASRRIDITALVQMQAAASVRVDAITAAAAAAAACACAAAASDSQQPGVTVPLLPDSQQPGVTGPLLLKPPESTFAAAAAAVLVPAAAGVSDADLNEQLAFHLAAPTLSIDAAAQPAAAAAEPHLIVKKERPRSQSTGRMNSLTRLEVFHRWLQERRIDPFSCAHRCDSVLRLALLVEQYGRSSNSTSFVFAGICVLQAAFEQSSIAPPDSLSSWQQLLSLTPETARLSRQSDSLWYHVRRGGPAFCESVPTKAREDTLTALAIIAAIAPHHQAMAELWAYSQQRLFPSTFVALIDVAPLLGLAPLLSCYCLALVAALQEPRVNHRCGVLHGVKHLKALFTIFTRTSSWCSDMRHRGPWQYEWEPPMARLQRDLSASFIVTMCLEEQERIPEDADIARAVKQAGEMQAAPQWQQLQSLLQKAHAQLDAALSADHVAALAAVLAQVATSGAQLKSKALSA